MSVLRRMTRTVCILHMFMLTKCNFRARLFMPIGTQCKRQNENKANKMSTFYNTKYRRARVQKRKAEQKRKKNKNYGFLCVS